MLDDASAKICDIFGFEAIRQVVEMKSDVYVNLPAGYGQSVAFPRFASESIDKREKNILIVISPLFNLMKVQVSRLSSLGVQRDIAQ